MKSISTYVRIAVLHRAFVSALIVLVINMSFFQPKSILKTEFDRSRYGESFFDTPSLWKPLFLLVLMILCFFFRFLMNFAFLPIAVVASRRRRRRVAVSLSRRVAAVVVASPLYYFSQKKRKLLKNSKWLINRYAYDKNIGTSMIKNQTMYVLTTSGMHHGPQDEI